MAVSGRALLIADSATAAGSAAVVAEGTAVAVMGAKSIAGRASLLVVTVALLGFVAACDGAREVDYRPSRGISADIDATHEVGATSLRRGMTTETEPLGAMPWRLGERHQGE
jgi:hypothetical protein